MVQGKAIEGRTEPSRYVVGVDLGTTNSAVAYVDTQQEKWTVTAFAVPQVVAPNQVENRPVLPSFHYQAATDELPAGALKLPWERKEKDYAVGVFARDHGAAVPGRLVSSAKSWLSHPGVDRTADLLPWHGAEDVDRLSPVEASSRYLAHLRDAWNDHFPEYPLAEQDLVLTLPASFDEVARELTVAAAAKAGLPRVVLIEEPQAAFYSWLHKHDEHWEMMVEPGQKILVCDIGGGTTDFTLIRVRRSETEKVQFHRVAVGDHLILGGDNFDLALAQHVERKLMGEKKLSPRQWDALIRVARSTKERLLGSNPPEAVTLNLPGSGAKLLSGSLQVEITRAEVQQVLIDGFLPVAKLDDKPASRRSGFQEFALPYAPDPAITRYLAAFLTAHRHVAMEDDEQPAHDPARPDLVLFNGGVFESPDIQRRLLEVMQNWFRKDDPTWSPQVLENTQLDLAVAQGAAYYGMVRRGQGVRIAAGLARTYYIGVESEPPQAVCLVPANAEPGQDVDLTQHTFQLLVSEPVEFPLHISSTRLTDLPGQLLEIDRHQMAPLAPIRTVLKTKRKDETGTVAVQLHARLTEIGTLDLWCSEREGPRSWRLQFDVRSATQTDKGQHAGEGEQAGVVDEQSWQQCQQELQNAFGPQGSEKPDGIMKLLASALGSDRWEWPPSVLRRIWETLIEFEDCRRRSASHEARWLNVLGFSLRPGYGVAVDDWRVAETWRVLASKLRHPTVACRTEWWILWRRISGGLSASQQRTLADPLLAGIRGLHRQLTTGKGSGDFHYEGQEALEIWRFLGSLELLPVSLKMELGKMVVAIWPKKKTLPFRPALTWTLGRLGARVPLYGPLNTVIPISTAETWLEFVLDHTGDTPLDHLCAMQLSRMTSDRHRDLSEKTGSRVLGWLERNSASPHLLELVSTVRPLASTEQAQLFGDSLPKGLRL